jgi:hypothetical protein
MMTIDNHGNSGLRKGALDRGDKAAQRNESIPWEATEGMLIILATIYEDESAFSGFHEAVEEGDIHLQSLLRIGEGLAHGRTVTGVPASTLRKKVSAMWVGIRTQPWEAANPGR